MAAVSPAASAPAAGPSTEQIKASVAELLATVDRDSTSVFKFRRMVSQHMGLGKKGLEARADEVNDLIKQALQTSSPSATPAQRIAAIVQDLGDEDGDHKGVAYLGTISRVLADTQAASNLRDIKATSRPELAECVRNAFDDPLPDPLGRGRKCARTEGIVKKIVVFKEAHQDGDVHFHVGVLLATPRTWRSAKRTLRERDHVPSHWSCSHTQFWSIVRYGFFPTLKKPDVDPEPYVWTADNSELDLFEASQKPWNAKMWKRRAEEAEKRRSAGTEKTKARFTKLDLTATILERSLKTKTEILEYAQEKGTELMQHFVHNHQKHLKDYLADALEWGAAREKANLDRETDWNLVCRVAAEACPHGADCTYAAAASKFFDANRATLSKLELSAALRAIILRGPSKTTRTPWIIGPTNTGKSTLVLPFDELFGSNRVFYKPAFGSSCPLRNILKDKRFLFWDDYRPVEFAQETIDVPTFLSLFTGHPFEVQVSQAFSDGNEDFEWRRGAVITAKAKDLWEPWGEVDDEDVRHMKSRVHMFNCCAKLPELRDTSPCTQCMCSWIVSGSNQHDAAPVLQQPVMPLQSNSSSTWATPHGPHRPGEVLGLSALAAKVQLPEAVVDALGADMSALGAIHVNELTADDWKSLPSWSRLRVLEQRRLLANLCASI